MGISSRASQLVSLVVLCFVTSRGLADDWPQWRGPNRDGVVRGAKLPAKWPKALKEEWKATIGEAYSSPVVVGNSVYAFTRQKDDEILWCFDVTTGKELWRSEPYRAPFKGGPAASGDIMPRATPAVADGRVFTLGVSETLSAWDARSGKLLWRKESKTAPIYGASASPMTINGLCIAAVGRGGLTAFDAATGEVKWARDDVIGGPAYGSPVLVNPAGERHIAGVAQNGFLGLASDTGKVLWRVPIARWDLQQCITPVQYKDLVILADAGDSLRAVRIEKADNGLVAKEAWKAKPHTRNGYHTVTPVIAGDWLFGFSGEKLGHLFCLDAKTGQTLWESDARLGGHPSPHASIVNAGDVCLALTNRGYLVVFKTSGTAFEPIAEYRVAPPERGGTDACPVLVGDRILLRDATTLWCFRIVADDGK